jgi:hypothetical protein
MLIGLHSDVAKTGGRTTDTVTVLVTVLSVTEVAVMTTLVVAVIAGAENVTANGALPESDPQLPAVNFPSLAQPDCFSSVQVTPAAVVSPPTAAVKLSVLGAAGAAGLSSIVSKPFAETITIEIVDFEPPPPQPLDSIKARHARQKTAANRILIMQPPEFP